MRDRAAVVVDDGRVRDVAAVGGSRFQDRSDALIGAEGETRDRRRRQSPRARAGKSCGRSASPMPRLSSSPTRARFARCCTLNAVIASAISSVTAAVCLARRLTRISDQGFSASCRNRFSLLCSVLTVTPRISAARVLLSRVCTSVSSMRRRSASSTVMPGVRPTD